MGADREYPRTRGQFFGFAEHGGIGRSGVGFGQENRRDGTGLPRQRQIAFQLARVRSGDEGLQDEHIVEIGRDRLFSAAGGGRIEPGKDRSARQGFDDEAVAVFPLVQQNEIPCGRQTFAACAIGSDLQTCMAEALVTDDFKAVAVDRRNAGGDAVRELGPEAGTESVGFDGHDGIPPNTV